jgi:hypothetical protein
MAAISINGRHLWFNGCFGFALPLPCSSNLFRLVAIILVLSERPRKRALKSGSLERLTVKILHRDINCKTVKISTGLYPRYEHVAYIRVPTSEPSWTALLSEAQ